MRLFRSSFVICVALAVGLTACGSDTATPTKTTAGFGAPGSTITTAAPADTRCPPPTASAAASSPTPKEGNAGVEVTGELGAKPEIKLTSCDAPTELLYQDLTVGTGTEIKVDTKPTFQYVGISWSTGKEFDASWEREPFTSRLSKGALIDGWVNGIPGMKVGGRRLLVIPADQGYGSGGQPPDIGPNETLVFVIDAV